MIERRSNRRARNGRKTPKNVLFVFQNCTFRFADYIGLTYIISKDMDPLIRCSITGAMPAVLGVAFIGDGSVTKALKKQRAKLLRCPKCGHPISDFDIENRQCSRCKAH